MICEELRELCKLDYKSFLEAAEGEDDKYWEGKYFRLRSSIITLVNDFDEELMQRLLERARK